MGRARLVEVEVPGFGMPDETPDLAAAVYAARLERLRARADERGYDRLVVYADREHSANLAYLTGFDPRFEEAILVVGPTGEPAVLVGNECWGMAGAAPVPMRRHLYQHLSLPSQPRGRSRTLREILGDEGVGPDSRVGVIGWKTYPEPSMLDAPAYLVDELRSITGASGVVENATDLLIDPAGGLRVVNEVEQLARGRPPARVGRHPDVVPSHVDRRAPCALRPAQSGGSAHRARRPVHRRLRDLGGAELPGRVRRRRRVGASRTHP